MSTDSAMRDLINRYASELEGIYTNRTAGDYTWQGLLYSFAQEVSDALRVEDGVEPEPSTLTLTYNSETLDRVKYLVHVRGNEVTCECPGFRYQGHCKHVGWAKRDAGL